MKDDKRFFVKLLGILTMQTQNISERFILKLLKGAGVILLLLGFMFNFDGLADLIRALQGR